MIGDPVVDLLKELYVAAPWIAVRVDDTIKAYLEMKKDYKSLESRCSELQGSLWAAQAKAKRVIRKSRRHKQEKKHVAFVSRCGIID